MTFLRSTWTHLKLLTAVVLAHEVCLAPVQAVIFLNFSDPNYNISAPGGQLAGSGWQYEGQWGNFLGTAIGANYFITATHVGGTVGQSFQYNGFSYPTVARYNSPSSDLTLWQIDGTFSSYASLYTAQDEVGKELVVIGRGTQQGTPLTVDSETKGWYWGTSDHVTRWGENVVDSIDSTSATYGDLLYSTFDRNALVNEAHLSVGDSGGAVFIQDTTDQQWKLAGINLGVDAYFNLTGTDGQGFVAALYDIGGLYIGRDGSWTYVPDQSSDISSGFYASRISSNLDWINSVMVPEPGAATVLTALGCLGWVLLRRRWAKASATRGRL